MLVIDVTKGSSGLPKESETAAERRGAVSVVHLERQQLLDSCNFPRRWL